MNNLSNFRVKKNSSIVVPLENRNKASSFFDRLFIETVFGDRSTVSIICACRANRRMRVARTTKTKRGRSVTHSWHACGHASSIVHWNPSQSGTRPSSSWTRVWNSVYAFGHGGKWVEKSGWFAAVAGLESTVCI